MDENKMTLGILYGDNFLKNMVVSVLKHVNEEVVLKILKQDEGTKRREDARSLGPTCSKVLQCKVR